MARCGVKMGYLSLSLLILSMLIFLKQLAWGARGRRFKSCHADHSQVPSFTRKILKLVFKFCRYIYALKCSKMHRKEAEIYGKNGVFPNSSSSLRYGLLKGRYSSSLSSEKSRSTNKNIFLNFGVSDV